MPGYKQVGDVEVCLGPCCPGYHEVVEHPPLLDRVVYCKRDDIWPLLIKPTMNWNKNQEKTMGKWK